MSEHKFRYLLPPGNTFQFVPKFRTWIVVSFLLMAACVGALFVNKARHGQYMNWTIDFSGGSEIIFAFKDKAKGEYVKVDPHDVRVAFDAAGDKDVEVSEITYAVDTDKGSATVYGQIVRTARFAAVKPEAQAKAADAFKAKFADRELLKVTWSGDRLYVRSKKAIAHDEATPVFAEAGLDPKPWDAKETSQYAHPDEGNGEYNAAFSLWGLDRQYEQILEKAMPTVDVEVAQSYGVGAKAGDKLRDDAAKSIIYAIFLIMLYLAFRFDIRYAPGAAFATIHDAVMVIGVFAVTWTEVSLTSVAGLLTVIGYSVNDTVIVFDRIRENQAKLKDKKLERIIDISLNEMLVRTILTSLTVFATTLVMNIFGTGLVKNFAFAMNIGVIVGTYSSIFLAAPIFMYVSRRWYSGPARTRRRPAAPVAPAATAPRAAEDDGPSAA